MARAVMDRTEIITPLDLVFPDDREIYSSTLVSDLLMFTTNRKQSKLYHWQDSLYCDDVSEKSSMAFELAKLVVADTRLGNYLHTRAITRLVKILDTKQGSDNETFALQYYSTLILANVVCSRIGIVVRHRAIPSLLTLVPCTDTFVQTQALVTLTNIAAEFSDSCSTMIEKGVFALLNSLFEDRLAHFAALKSAGELLVVFCRVGVPSVEKLVNIVSKGMHLEYEASLKPLCLAFSILSDKQLIATGTEFPRLLRLIHYETHQIVFSALWTIGNYVRHGDEGDIDTMIEQTLLTGCARMLSHEYAIIRKEACWIISNITAGNHSQIEDVISMLIIERLVETLRIDDFDVKELAARAILNAIRGSNGEQLWYFREECLPLVDEVQVSSGDDLLVVEHCSTIRLHLEQELLRDWLCESLHYV